MNASDARPPSVNYHLWQPCNMSCKFCFATFQDVITDVLPTGHLAKVDAARLVRLLAAEFEKITFAGGEPTLCPWLPELMRLAHEDGATTMLVTNGTRLTDAWLDLVAPDLDWTTLSVDSADATVLDALGRRTRREVLTAAVYTRLADAIRRRGIRLKLNTVVSSLNHEEDMTSLVRQLKPERWKIMRVMSVRGQNDRHFDELAVSPSAFLAFVERHRDRLPGTVLVPEDNDDMRGSYAMVDPAGRFFDSTTGTHRYSPPILEAGLQAAWAEVAFSRSRFNARGGFYEW